MPRKNAKQLVDQVVAKVSKDPKPKDEVTVEEVTHLRQCMVNIAPGSKCNCPASRPQ